MSHSLNFVNNVVLYVEQRCNGEGKSFTAFANRGIDLRTETGAFSQNFLRNGPKIGKKSSLKALASVEALPSVVPVPLDYYKVKPVFLCVFHHSNNVTLISLQILDSRNGVIQQRDGATRVCVQIRDSSRGRI